MSSHAYQTRDRYRVIAPDLPGFGETKAPSRANWIYSIANLAKTMEGFVDAIGLDRYAIYTFDYGAPTVCDWPSPRSAPRPTGEISRPPKSTSSTPVTSLWKPTVLRSPD